MEEQSQFVSSLIERLELLERERKVLVYKMSMMETQHAEELLKKDDDIKALRVQIKAYEETLRYWKAEHDSLLIRQRTLLEDITKAVGKGINK